MSEKKLYCWRVMQESPKIEAWGEATEQDLKELGWVKAEPTPCSECEHCEFGEHGPIACGRGYDHIFDAWCMDYGMEGEGVHICIEFVPNEKEKKGMVKG